VSSHRVVIRERATSKTSRGALISVATVFVVIGLAIAAFFNPLWIGFEQERVGVPAITGYTPDQVDGVTGSILSDLFLGPPEFAAAVNGQPVLDAAERSHMMDVRAVLLGFGIVLGIGVTTLVGFLAARRREAWVWRAIARGSGALVLAGFVVGVSVVFFFDAAFQLFHVIFFPQGNFSFDPRTERLTQLFPDQFWTETTIGIVALGMTLALAVTLIARRRASRLAG
jgi:integral membrane protein (TIGR01906 family)